jgi:hypothetical protein
MILYYFVLFIFMNAGKKAPRFSLNKKSKHVLNSF